MKHASPLTVQKRREIGIVKALGRQTFRQIIGFFLGTGVWTELQRCFCER